MFWHAKRLCCDPSLCCCPLLTPHALLRLQAVQARPKQPTACDFACYIVSACIVREPILAASDLLHTLDALSKLARTLAQPNSMQLMSLVEQARRPRWVSTKIAFSCNDLVFKPCPISPGFTLP